MITGKIDVSKIDKSKLFKGEKGTYLDIILIETPNGQYGDYMIAQSVSKEERAAGVKGAILGNAKNLNSGSSPQQGQRRPVNTTVPTAAKAADDESSDVPF